MLPPCSDLARRSTGQQTVVGGKPTNRESDPPPSRPSQGQRPRRNAANKHAPGGPSAFFTGDGVSTRRVLAAGRGEAGRATLGII